MAGRPREFCRDDALQKAKALFWKKGYECTSMNDLLGELGIQRQSLYQAFGSKRALFLEALDLYLAEGVAKKREALEQPGSPLGNLKALIRDLGKAATEEGCPGCFINNAGVEFGSKDQEVRSRIDNMTAEIEAIYFETLKRAAKAGEIPTEKATRALARLILVISHGFASMGRAKMKPAVARDAAEQAITLLE